MSLTPKTNRTLTADLRLLAEGFEVEIKNLTENLERSQNGLRLALERVVREIARDKGTEAFKILPILEAAVTTSRSLLAAEHQEQHARTST